LSKNVSEAPTNKKTLIYNYGYLKKDREEGKKRTLVTLPAEPYRVEVHPKEKIVNTRIVRTQSKSNKVMKVQSLPREVERVKDTSSHRYGRSEEKRK
jgi:hypothetical protein